MPIQNRGHHVPIVAFYSIQGGVGKSTLARKFAELVTIAPGRDGRRPNVLLVDLDVDAKGLTFRLAQGLRQSFRTVHQVIAERNINVVQGIDVTGTVSLAGGNPKDRGKLYLMPAAPPDARALFDTEAGIDRQELYQLLLDMIHALVMQYEISCVVIDCAPAASPYSAAAATLSDVPLLIGRNEPATYDQIRELPERFREMYPAFQPPLQRVIINAVSVKELFEQRAEKYSILDYIPLIGDVIHETEGLSRVSSFRMLLFEKYVVDIIRQVFLGHDHLKPEAPEVLGQEWIEALRKLERCEEAPRVRRLRPFRHLRWAGAGLVVTGIGLYASPRVFETLPMLFRTVGLVGIFVGAALAIAGWYSESERNRLLAAARELVLSGPDEVFKKLKEGISHRRLLEEMRKLADTIPAPAQGHQ